MPVWIADRFIGSSEVGESLPKRNVWGKWIDSTQGRWLEKIEERDRRSILRMGIERITKHGKAFAEASPKSKKKKRKRKRMKVVESRIVVEEASRDPWKMQRKKNVMCTGMVNGEAALERVQAQGSDYLLNACSFRGEGSSCVRYQHRYWSETLRLHPRTVDPKVG